MATTGPPKGPTVHSLVAGLHKLQSRHARAANIPTKAEELKALTNALKGAMTLEFATIPPYLTALWSIKEDLHPIAASLRNIVQEEMLHLALASNMLAAKVSSRQ